jgi:hypothetical protein
MSRNPNNQNFVQAHLYHAGEKRMGHELANVSADTQVRREGLKHLGRKVAAGALAVGSMIGVAEFVGHAYDRSPTVVYQQKLHEQQGHQTHIDVTQSGVSNEIPVHIGTTSAEAPPSDK